jgi:hypothetical protein
MGLTNPNTGKAVAPAAVVNPGGSAATPSSADVQALMAAASGGSNLYANMVTKTNTTNLTQTSPQDIEGLVNATMQSLLGRNATPQEIQTYGQELLAAEKSNPGQFNELTKYGPTGKRADVTGTQVSTGVEPQSFLQTIIQNTGEARQYYAINNYMGALQSLTDQYRGPM